MFKKIIINDANILIDLIKLELINPFFRLEKIKYVTTDFVFEELYEEQKQQLHSFIQAGQLEIINSSGEELIEISKIASSSNGLSIQDCSVYYFASKLQGILLTGDGKLRKFSTKKGIEVHGIIYLFDEFLSNHIIDYQTAIKKIELLLSFNTRLPKKEIEKQIEEWKDKLI